MTTTTLTPQGILTSLTRIVHPDFAIDVVNLGTVFGIELSQDTVGSTTA